MIKGVLLLGLLFISIFAYSVLGEEEVEVVQQGVVEQTAEGTVDNENGEVAEEQPAVEEGELKEGDHGEEAEGDQQEEEAEGDQQAEEEGEWPEGDWQHEEHHDNWDEEGGHFHDDLDDPNKEFIWYYLDEEVSHYELLVFLFTHHPKNWGDDYDFEDAMQKLRDNRFKNTKDFIRRREEYLDFERNKQQYLETREERRRRRIKDEL